METLKFGGFFEAKYQFKSYYVVWKPLHGKKKNCCEVEFKSYYVVWKRMKKYRIE